jgi:predicted site-specific integrase-resolvase
METNVNYQKLSYTLKEAAQATGLSYTTLWRQVQRGNIRTVPGIRTRIIPTCELEKFLAEGVAQ